MNVQFRNNPRFRWHSLYVILKSPSSPYFPLTSFLEWFLGRASAVRRVNAHGIDRILFSRFQAVPLSLSQVEKQFEILLASADKEFSQRMSMNTFFLTGNSGLVGGIGWCLITLVQRDVPTLGSDAAFVALFLWILWVFAAGVGLQVSWIWSELLDSYLNASNVRNEILKLLESKLYISPFSATLFLKRRSGIRDMVEAEQFLPGLFRFVYICSVGYGSSKVLLFFFNVPFPFGIVKN